ncbi:MAG: SRPBCC family protein [Steroidobacteraceae bacterium]
MEIHQSFKVLFAPDQVWRCFHDIEGIIACLPGAELTAPPSDGRLVLSMTVKLGPIVANFAGQGEMTLNDATRSGRIVGGGSDWKSGSRVKGEASFSLHDESVKTSSTRIDIRVDYSMAGSLAQFSRGGIVRELAERITAQFSDNLRKKLDAGHAEPATTPADRAGAPPAATPTRAAPTPAAALDFGKIFWPMLIARLKRWFGLSAKRSDDAHSRDD